jgi:UDP-GlcNAc3NAcA epimerase
MKKILAVVGARPQFIKHAPIEFAFQGRYDLVTVHTGQHYDDNMSRIFFDQLGMSRPTYTLSGGSYGHGVQTGRMMIELEPIVEQEKPDAILVYGDTNSTLAGALVGAKMHIPIIHLEAGLRSYNKTMPEEINRVLTDHVSDLLLVPTAQAVENLRKEGVEQNVYPCGDVMCDMLKIAERTLEAPKGVESGQYAYATLHRPYNTDDPARLSTVLNALNGLSLPVLLALHPRTRHKMQHFGMPESLFSNITFLEPVSYFDNIAYQKHARALITDSGGMQKEAYLLRTPCATIRSETEWTETLAYGWNRLVFEDLSALEDVLHVRPDGYDPDVYGTGRAAYEIADLVEAFFEGR